MSLAAALMLVLPTTAFGVLALERVSVSSAGVQGSGYGSECVPSANGRFVAFFSRSSEMVVGDTNLLGDIFVRDRLTGAVERVSVGSGGEQADGESYDCDISDDGRYVSFGSGATNLLGAGADTNAKSDVFVRDRVLGTTQRVSVGVSGVQGNGDSDLSRISADGNRVAFRSSATNLIAAADTNALDDMFLHDRAANKTVRVSVDSSGIQADGNSYRLDMSASGRYVVFESDATNLVGIADTNSQYDIFLKDVTTGATSRISVSSSGVQGNGGSFAPAINADGRYVVYSAYADNLVLGDTNGQNDIFIRDVLANTTTMVTHGLGGVAANDRSLFPSISGDGGVVAYQAIATNLVAGDTNAVDDVFVTRLSDGTTERVSANLAGVQGNSFSYAPHLSADGRYVGFESAATNLVAGDTNGVYDAFLVTLVARDTRIVRAPSASSKTYRRKKRVAKYTLTATVTDQIGIPIIGARVYLQRYDTKKKRWKNLCSRTTSASGTAGVSFKSRTGSTRYYRWYVPAASDHTAAWTGKQKIRVK
jgi:hypothetical protein